MKQSTTDSRNDGAARAWAYTGMLIGGTVSLAANVAHSLLRPDPPIGSIAFSVLWPVLLFVVTEVVLRNGFGGIRSTLAWVGLTPVALIAAAASYQHLSGLLAAYGETRFVVLGGPLAIDGLMVLCTGLLFVSKPARHTKPVETVKARTPTETLEEEAATAATVYPINGLSKTRRAQVDRIRTAVPDPSARAALTWEEIGRIVGVKGRASLQRIRAALTATDQALGHQEAVWAATP